jgi:prepilin-type processing-associated H-X9-DG protein
MDLSGNHHRYTYSMPESNANGDMTVVSVAGRPGSHVTQRPHLRVKQSQVRQSSQTLVLIEAGGVTSPGDMYTWTNRWYTWIHNNGTRFKSGRSNMLMADWHVESQPEGWLFANWQYYRAVQKP